MDQNKNSNKQEDKLVQLEKENAELKTKVGELENNWKRALADYINFQRRTAEEQSTFFEYACASFVLRVLPTLDHLEMLLSHIKDSGLDMIVKQLKQTLEEEGVTEAVVLNKEFDSTTMEAVENVVGEKNKVIEVIQKGYFLKEKLIRPARVKVGSGESQKEDN